MRRRLIAVVVLVVALGAVALVARPQAIVVDLATIERGTLRADVEEEGRTRLRHHVVVSAPVAGTLLAPSLQVGDAVVAGQVIARIEPAAAPPLTSDERAGLQAAVRAAEAALAQARAGRARGQAAEETADAEVLRMQRLAEAGGVPRVQLDDAKARAHALSHEVEALSFAADVAKNQVLVARTSLLRASNASGGPPFELSAPIGGRVVAIFAEHAGPVGPAVPLVEIGDLASLEVVVPIATDDAARLPPNARARLSGWGGPEGEGRVQLIEPKAFTKISALGVEEARVNVVVALDAAPPPGVGDGWRVRVALVVWQADDLVLVPVAALVRDGPGYAVFVDEEQRARRRSVNIGRRSGRLAEVSGGLEPGARVVLHPAERVQDGARLRARTEAP